MPKKKRLASKSKVNLEFEFIILLGASVFLFVVFYLFKIPNLVFAAAANHVVISEIQTGAVGASTNEFVELYNPTASEINLVNWRLAKRTSAGTLESEVNLIATMSGIIPSHGYFLIASDTYSLSATTSADLSYESETNSVSNGNTVLLYDPVNTVIDKIGIGEATDFETDSETDPGAGTSRERKALETSTTATMMIGGVDEFLGNGEDTDNNNADFNGRAIPQPQNSQSSIEPTNGASPSATATVTVTPTATPIESSSPTATSSPTVTATATASSSPTETATATPTVSSSVSPTASAQPSKTPLALGTIMGRLACRFEYKVINFGWFSFFMPKLSCDRV